MPDRNDVEYRRQVWQQIAETYPHLLMTPPEELPEGPKYDMSAYRLRYSKWREESIDAEITRHENDARARENQGILLRLKAFMGGPHGAPVPYDSEHQAYWDARIAEERARMGLPP
jgi:hypothetical protein